MLEEGRKLRIASKVADAILAAAAAATMAQSPQHFVSFGAVQSSGVAQEQEKGRKRGEAERNLDSGRVSHPARNRKMKTFREFVEEAYLFEGRSREEAEKMRMAKDNPDEWRVRKVGRAGEEHWTTKRKTAIAGQEQRRAETIKSLNTPEERAAADKKKEKLNRAGLEHHHITPLHYSSKLRKSMSPEQWAQRVERDAADGIYHGHHPKNIMGAVTDKTPESRSRTGIRHGVGGAHELEGKTKDIAHVGHKGLLSAAHRQDLRRRKEENKK